MAKNNLHKSRARLYRKSTLPRLRWTPELHDQFVGAVHNLGGKYKATPKRIMHMMGVNGLKISHIKSHLQMYRSMKEATNLDGFISVKKYHGDIRRPVRHRPGLKDEPAHTKIRMNKFYNKEEYYGYLEVQGTQGTASSAVTESDKAEIQRAVSRDLPAMELLDLGRSYQQEYSESSRHITINLDLTM